MRRTAPLGALISAGLLVGTLAGSAPAGAGPPSLANRLLSASAARHLGFPSFARKAFVTHKTGDKGCGTGAQVVYQNKTTLKGLILEVFACKSPSAAKSLIRSYETTYAPTPAFTPPKALGLGPLALGSGAGAPVYAYYWPRGSYGAFVAVDTDATNNKAQAVAHEHDPLTPALESSLQQAAVELNAKLG